MIKSLRFKNCDQECRWYFIYMFGNRIFPLTILLNFYATEHYDHVNANKDYNNATSKDDILFIRNYLLNKPTHVMGYYRPTHSFWGPRCHDAWVVLQVRIGWTSCLRRSREPAARMQPRTGRYAFFPRYSRLYVTAFVFISAEISWYKNETDALFGETSHYLLCTVRVIFLLLSGSITGLNKCDTYPRIYKCRRYRFILC
jgi:hypothetical protein